MNEIVVELSKKKILLLIVGSFVFVALGIWMLTLDGETIAEQRRLNNPMILYGIGLLSILFFGLAALYGIRKMFDTSPGLILNNEGFVDNSSGLAAGLIPWKEVTAIEHYEIQRQKIIAILVTDPEKYIQSGGALRKMANQANMKMSGTPINISTNSLKISHDELLALFHEYASTAQRTG